MHVLSLRQLLAVSYIMLTLRAGPLQGADPPRLAPAPKVLLQPVEGEPLEAVLLGVDSQRTATFEAAASTKPVALDDLVEWGNWPELPVSTSLVLANSDILVADGPVLVEDSLKADSLTFGPIELPVAALAGIILNPPAGRLDLERLQTQIASPAVATSDELILVNGDRLSGRITALSADVVSLDTAGTNIDVPAATVAALVFNQALRSKLASDASAAVGLLDGSRLTAQSLLLDRQKLQLTLAAGAELTTSPEEVVAMQPVSRRVVYLSDVEPVSYRHVPFFEVGWDYRRDQNVVGGELRSGGRIYRKGLGVHSAAGLTYAVPPGTKRFEAELAIDDHAQRRGSVVFKVYTDAGSGRWEAAYTSPVVRGGVPVVRCSVDVSKVKNISLLVEFADRGDELDHANWLNARFVQ